MDIRKELSSKISQVVGQFGQMGRINRGLCGVFSSHFLSLVESKAVEGLVTVY